MGNEELAQLFEDIADFLELEDSNPFRIRAYRNAARNVRGLTEDISVVAARQELTRIPGIGPDLSQKIEEYLATKHIKFHDELLKKTPPVLVQMLDIPSVGPKTARLIYDRLKPKDLTRLAELARASKIRGLPGIQEKTEQNILDGLEFLMKSRERTPIGTALPLARRILQELGQLPGVDQIAHAGSLRRMRETIRDIDILITSKKPAPIMDSFVHMPDVEKVLAHGDTKSSIMSRKGIQIDLRVVRPKAFGAALLYFTGSKEHNIKLRNLAKKRALKINEYGLMNEQPEKVIASRTEEEIYRALRLDFIPPELREDRGEIEASAAHRLPELVEITDIRGDFHTHSNWSDGVHEIEEMAEAARKRDLEYMVLTDHSQSLRVANGLSPKDLLRQIERIRKLNQKRKGFTLLAGSEVDILPDGTLDYKDDLLKELDFVVASVHTGFKQTKSQITKRVIRAMQNRYVNLIAHPTGRLLGEREAYEVDFDEIFRMAKETHTALEINAQPARLDLNEQHARRAHELGIMLAIDTDSHSREQFENLEYGLALARRAWCTKDLILNCLPLHEFRKRIKKR